jgi:hypothetical protein
MTTPSINSTTQTTPNTMETAMQTLDMHPSTLIKAATSLLKMPTQLPSTTTTLLSTALKKTTAPLKQWHTFPNQLMAPLLAPQPLISHPGLSIATATLSPTTATTPGAYCQKMTVRVSSSTQMAADTPNMVDEVINDAQGPSIAKETDLQDNEQLHLSKCIIYMMDESCQLCKPKQWPMPPPTLPHHPKHDPQTPITCYEPHATIAMSWPIMMKAPINSLTK